MLGRLLLAWPRYALWGTFGGGGLQAASQQPRRFVWQSNIVWWCWRDFWPSLSFTSTPFASGFSAPYSLVKSRGKNLFLFIIYLLEARIPVSAVCEKKGGRRATWFPLAARAKEKQATPLSLGPPDEYSRALFILPRNLPPPPPLSFGFLQQQRAIFPWLCPINIPDGWRIVWFWPQFLVLVLLVNAILLGTLPIQKKIISFDNGRM